MLLAVGVEQFKSFVYGGLPGGELALPFMLHHKS
jgi:hypothetical protein